MRTSGFALDETLVYRIIVDLTWTEPGKTSETDMQDGEAGAGHATDIDPEGLISKMDESNAAVLVQDVAHTDKDMGVVGEASPGEAKRGRGRPPKKNGVAKPTEKLSVDGVKRGRGRPPKAKAEDGNKAHEEGGAKTTTTGTPGRGRGRPPKAKVDKASTSEADKSAEDDEEAVDADDSPSKPKRGRGRPPKAKGESDETSKKAKVGGKDGDASDSSAGNNTDPAKPKRGRGRPPKAKGDEPEKAGKEKEDEACEGETDAVKGGAAAPEKKRGRGRPPKTKA